MQLNRELIIDAGLDILNSYGLGDMTMRRLATQLGVAPGALYWHFANKQSLLEAIAEHLLVPLRSAEHTTAAPAAERFRAAILAVRDGAEVVSIGLAMPRLGAIVTSYFAAALGRETPSLAPPQIILGAVTLTHFAMGAISAEQASTQLGTAEGTDYARQFTEGVQVILAGLR